MLFDIAFDYVWALRLTGHDELRGLFWVWKCLVPQYIVEKCIAIIKLDTEFARVGFEEKIIQVEK